MVKYGLRSLLIQELKDAMYTPFFFTILNVSVIIFKSFSSQIFEK